MWISSTTAYLSLVCIVVLVLQNTGFFYRKFIPNISETDTRIAQKIIPPGSSVRHLSAGMICFSKFVEWRAVPDDIPQKYQKFRKSEKFSCKYITRTKPNLSAVAETFGLHIIQFFKEYNISHDHVTIKCAFILPSNTFRGPAQPSDPHHYYFRNFIWKYFWLEDGEKRFGSIAFDRTFAELIRTYH